MAINPSTSSSPASTSEPTSKTSPTSSSSSPPSSSSSPPAASEKPTPAVRATSEAPATATPVALQSDYGSSSSEPDRAQAVVQEQAEAARAVTGDPPDPEVEEYRANRERLEELREQPVTPEDPMAVGLEMQQLENDMYLPQLEAGIAYDDDLGKLQDRFEDMTEMAQQVAAVRAEVGAFIEGDAAELFETHLAEQMATVSQPLEDATQRFVERLNDPLLQETMRDWPALEQEEFFAEASRLLGYSEAGQERIASFMDGLAGLSDDPLAELAVELREERASSGLDNSLGLLAGIDAQARPDGAEERAQVVADALGIEPESSFFAAREIGTDAFAALAGQLPKAVEQGAHQAARLVDSMNGDSRVLQLVGRYAGGAGALLDTVSAVEKVQDGDLLGAAGSAAGVASFVAGFVAPRLAGPLGWAATGVTVLEMIADRGAYADFRREAVSQALGDDPMVDVLWGIDSGVVNLMNLDPNVSPRQALETRVSDILGSEWANLDPSVLHHDFWRLASADAQMRIR